MLFLQLPWCWSIKDLKLDILKIEAARWKDAVSKCKFKDEKIGSFLRAHNSWIALRGNAKAWWKNAKNCEAILLNSNTLGVRIIKTCQE
jgi:hypothetical protein